jgi:acetyltransferase-like isoleucine patch superfamily enzyme
MKKLFKLIKLISFKTIYFNFKYLPFKQAIKLPIFVSKKVYLLETNGEVILDGSFRSASIQIGYGEVGIFDNKRSRSIWQVSGKVIFKGRTNIGHGSKISVGSTGELILGEDFMITAESALVAFKHIEFGRNCLLSWDVLVMDTDFHTIRDENGVQINEPKEIIIGNHVWIGCRNLLLKGTCIPDNTIIAANSLVNGKLDGENKVFGGNPVTQLNEKVTWEI